MQARDEDVAAVGKEQDFIGGPGLLQLRRPVRRALEHVIEESKVERQTFLQ